MTTEEKLAELKRLHEAGRWSGPIDRRTSAQEGSRLEFAAWLRQTGRLTEFPAEAVVR